MKNEYFRCYRTSLRFVLLLVFMNSVAISLYSQTAEEKKALKIAQTSAALDKAKLNLIKAERKVTISDSLTDVVIQQQIEGKDQLKKLEIELKAIEKAFSIEEKAIYKLIDSKDEVESKKGTADLKALEAKYKADLKKNDTKAKSALKMTAKGDADEAKGSNQKGAAEDGLLKAQTGLEVAQAKFNSASGIESEKVEKSSKTKESKKDFKKKKKDLEKEKDKEE